MSITKLFWVLGVIPTALVFFRYSSRDMINSLGSAYGEFDRFICLVGAIAVGLAWIVWVPIWLLYKSLKPILTWLERG